MRRLRLGLLALGSSLALSGCVYGDNDCFSSDETGADVRLAMLDEKPEPRTYEREKSGSTRRDPYRRRGRYGRPYDPCW